MMMTTFISSDYGHDYGHDYDYDYNYNYGHDYGYGYGNGYTFNDPALVICSIHTIKCYYII